MIVMHRGRELPLTYQDMAPLLSALMGTPEITETPTGYVHTWTAEPVKFIPFDAATSYVPYVSGVNQIVRRNINRVLDAIATQMRENAVRDAKIGRHRVRFEKRRGRTSVKALA